jgi:hypothetical protein
MANIFEEERIVHLTGMEVENSWIKPPPAN